MSIKEIAEKAGVSAATVSRVLNHPDYRCSSEELRERIWKIAQELNYSPNEAARILKRGVDDAKTKKRNICILMTRNEDMQADPFFQELFEIIKSEIYKNSCVLAEVFQMPLFSDDRKCSQVNLLRVVEEMNTHLPTGSAAGLVIVGKCNREALQVLKKRFKNVVSVNLNSTSYGVDEVTCDGQKAAETAVGHLLGLGHRNIAYVGECRNELRFRGYQKALAGHALDINPAWVIPTGQTEPEGYAAMEKFLQMEEPPTGIFCANDITAVGVLRALAASREKYYYPSVISCDDIALAQEISPMLTTVHLPKEEMGKFAVYLLKDRMNGGHREAVRVEMEGKLMIRKSCTSVDETGWCDYII